MAAVAGEGGLTQAAIQDVRDDAVGRAACRKRTPARSAATRSANYRGCAPGWAAAAPATGSWRSVCIWASEGALALPTRLWKRDHKIQEGDVRNRTRTVPNCPVERSPRQCMAPEYRRPRKRLGGQRPFHGMEVGGVVAAVERSAEAGGVEAGSSKGNQAAEIDRDGARGDGVIGIAEIPREVVHIAENVATGAGGFAVAGEMRGVVQHGPALHHRKRAPGLGRAQRADFLIATSG